MQPTAADTPVLLQWAALEKGCRAVKQSIYLYFHEYISYNKNISLHCDRYSRAAWLGAEGEISISRKRGGSWGFYTRNWISNLILKKVSKMFAAGPGLCGAQSETAASLWYAKQFLIILKALLKYNADNNINNGLTKSRLIDSKLLLVDAVVFISQQWRPLNTRLLWQEKGMMLSAQDCCVPPAVSACQSDTQDDILTCWQVVQQWTVAMFRRETLEGGVAGAWLGSRLARPPHPALQMPRSHA